jgi:hypothetical protein
MLSQLERPSAEETAWKERERLMSAVTNSAAPDEYKAQARTAVELGANADDVLEVLGFDRESRKQSREARANVTSEITKAFSSGLEGAVIKRSQARIDDLIKNAWTSTGASGYVASYLPFDTPAYQLGKELDTFKAIVGFDRLDQMREESKSGGALGQVAVKELEFLQATQGSLDQFQDPQILKENVGDIAKAHENFRKLRSLVKAAEMGDTSVIGEIGKLSAEIDEIGANVTLYGQNNADIPAADEGAEFESRY